MLSNNEGPPLSPDVFADVESTERESAANNVHDCATELATATEYVFVDRLPKRSRFNSMKARRLQQLKQAEFFPGESTPPAPLPIRDWQHLKELSLAAVFPHLRRQARRKSDADWQRDYDYYQQDPTCSWPCMVEPRITLDLIWPLIKGLNLLPQPCCWTTRQSREAFKTAYIGLFENRRG